MAPRTKLPYTRASRVVVRQNKKIGKEALKFSPRQRKRQAKKIDKRDERVHYEVISEHSDSESEP